MPKINSQQYPISLSEKNKDLSSVPGFSSSPSEWAFGTFINVISNKRDRLVDSKPFMPIYIVKGEQVHEDQEPPVVFFYLDKKNNLIGGVFNNKNDSHNFSEKYPEKSLEQALSIFKVNEETYGKDGAAAIFKSINKSFPDIVEDNSILQKISIPFETSSSSLELNFDPSDFDDTVLSSIFEKLSEEGVDILKILTTANKKYENKITNILKVVNDSIKKKSKPSSETSLPTLSDDGYRKKEALASTNKKITEKCSSNKQKRMDTISFKKMVREDTISMNRECRKFWANVVPEKGNPMQEDLSKFFQRNMWIMLTGDTGIGKSYNPLDLAEKNNIAVADIKLHKDIEHHHLTGTKELSVDIDHEEMNTSFMTGPFIRALINAAEGAREGKGFLLILDELLRVKDNSLFISGFSEVGAGEYGFEYGEGVDFRKIMTPVDGPVWFKVSDFTEEDKNLYEISTSGNIYFHDTKDASNLLFDGDENECAERCWRGKIPSISREEYRVLIKGNNIPIVNKFSANQKVYVPSKSLYIVGTTNVGNGYTVSMKPDSAFARRFFPVPAQRPSVSFMVKKVIEEELYLRGPSIQATWTSDVLKKITKILETYFSAMDKKITSSSREEESEFGQKVNFSMIKSVVSGLSDKDPLNDKNFGILSELELTSKKFAPIDFSVSTEEMQKHPLVRAGLESIKEIKRGGVLHTSKGVNSSKKAPDIPSANMNGGISTSAERQKR